MILNDKIIKHFQSKLHSMFHKSHNSNHSINVETESRQAAEHAQSELNHKQTKRTQSQQITPNKRIHIAHYTGIIDRSLSRR